ncbi:S8 family peptidase [Salmonella enterica subsp. enterica serovar Mississippi]|nr:S8 family peptidase [Salmonella enterica subsp. enterica serovar Mississippi]
MVNRVSKKRNPFFHIPYNPRDLTGVETKGGGGKLFVNVDENYRVKLANELDSSFEALSEESRDYPELLKTLVFKIRDEAIAKSHRPMTLASDGNLEIAGHGKINEMLVAAHSASYRSLKTAILNRQTKAIKNNLSAIESIEPWTAERKTSLSSDELVRMKSIYVRLFRYNGDDANQKNIDAFREILDEEGLMYDEIIQPRNSFIFNIKELSTNDKVSIDKLLKFPGVKSAYPVPIVIPEQTDYLNAQGNSEILPPPVNGLPIVAVFDTGVSNAATALSPWIVGNDLYVLPPDTDYEHGTMVSSLIINSRKINNNHSWLPDSQSRIYNVCALESAGSDTALLTERLKAAIAKRPDIKVWNLSLGGGSYKNEEFSDFAIELDHLSDQYGVLFVVASGNYIPYNYNPPLSVRRWPVNGTYPDLLSSPSESVRSLTVGSIAHLETHDSYVKVGEPTPYSRRGPGPVFTPKPDVVHLGGGVHQAWCSGNTSLNVIGPDNRVYGGFGTSFSAPIISSMAANTWRSLEGNPNISVSPSLVKALIIHAAQLNSPKYDATERRYYGAGRPQGVLESLYDSDDSFTLVFQASLIPNMKWRKSNYPIPQCLIQDGKFKGEIIITASYNPPLDPNAGSEYVRANVELSFGVLDGESMKGKVPMEGEKGSSGYESAQIEHGGKWSPVKIHRQRFPNGISGDVWGLQAKVMLRANEPVLPNPLDVNIIVTIRSLDGNNSVHSDGIRALDATNWIKNQLSNQLPINV